MTKFQVLGELSEVIGALSTPSHTIEGILDHSFKYAGAFCLRHHEPGDLGWIILAQPLSPRIWLG
jgi:hypothetical protein